MYHPIKPCKQTNKKINPYSFKILKPFLIEKKIIGERNVVLFKPSKEFKEFVNLKDNG